MEKEMEKEKNILGENYYLKENIYTTKKEKENYIEMEYWNMKENFYLIKNGTGKDMIKLEI